MTFIAMTPLLTLRSLILILGLALLGLHQMCAQVINEDNQMPWNRNVCHAIRLCGSVTHEYLPYSGDPQTCLFYQIDLFTEQELCFSITGAPYEWVALFPDPQLDCSSITNTANFSDLVGPGTYYIAINWDSSSPLTVTIDFTCPPECLPIDCYDCLPTTGLEEGYYIVSAWVKKEGAPLGTVNYGDNPYPPYLIIEAPSGSLATIAPDGTYPVVEGWQLIEGRFEVPPSTSISIELKVDDGSALFDDIRLFPADGSMKCYVYDPTNLRFVAELDERHFATFYEYDNAGKLVRVKKETERGIMTIQESRKNDSHVTP